MWSEPHTAINKSLSVLECHCEKKLDTGRGNQCFFWRSGWSKKFNNILEKTQLWQEIKLRTWHTASCTTAYQINCGFCIHSSFSKLLNFLKTQVTLFLFLSDLTYSSFFPLFFFPHLQWMKDMWRSDPCYGNYGVDGSTCSFFIYLSEVRRDRNVGLIVTDPQNYDF